MTAPTETPVAGLTAADLMTRDVVVASEADSLASAWELMVRGRFHHLPIMRGELCVGLLDDRTLVHVWSPGSLSRTRRCLGELLSPRPPTVGPATPLVELARRMQDYGTDALLVVDIDGRLMGVVTVTDVVAALAGIG